MVNHHHHHHHPQHHHHHNQMVCCMCGDVGFPDKLFNCKRCCFRFQHSYCSNYYSESSHERIEICDWCQSQGNRNACSSSSARQGGSSRRSPVTVDARSEYSGERIKQHEVVSPTAAATPEKGGGRNPGGVPSPRQTTRRYKLLKDVMC